MATTRHGGGAWLVLCAAVALVLMQAQAQQNFPGFPNYSLGQCPTYQTSPDFTQEFIDQLTTLAEGYILLLSDGSADSCQRLKFLDENTFKYSYNDIANRPRIYSSIYTANVANLTHPASIRLNMVIGMMGADVLGRLNLLPLVVDADKLVVATCYQLGAIKNEQLMVFVPHPSTADALAIRDDLVTKNIPNAGRLAEISIDCGPARLRSPQPLPLRFYNLISALNNPARQTQNAAIRAAAVSNARNAASFRSALPVDETQETPAVPFYTGNFAVPTFYNYQQPFVSTFASGYPAAVTYNAQPAAPFVTYTGAAQGISANTFPNEIYTQFHKHAK